MFGAPVCVHDMYGDDLGIGHVPPPVRIGDVVAFEDAVYEVYDVVLTGQVLRITALVKVRPVRLAIASR